MRPLSPASDRSGSCRPTCELDSTCGTQDPLRRPAMKDVATLMRDLLSESLSRSAATAFDDAGVRATAAASPIPAPPRVVMNKGLLSKQLGGT